VAKSGKNGRQARRQAARKEAARQAGKRQPPQAQAPEPAAAQPASSRVAQPAPARGGGEPQAARDAVFGDPLGGAGRVAWWALVAAVFLVPVAMTNFTFLGLSVPFTWDQFDIAKVFVLRVLSLVALGAWAWHLLRRGGKVRHNPVDWLILAFLAWVAITTATSIHWPVALFGKPRRYEGFLAFVNYALIYFLAMQFVDHARRVHTLARALFFSSIVVAGYGVLQFLGVDPVRWGTLPFEANRAFSTFGNPDLLGGFLIFTVAVALGLALVEKSTWLRLVYWAGFGLNGLCLIVAFTRGAWIGGAAALLVLGVIAWRQRAPLRRLDLIPAGASAAVGVAAIVQSLSKPSEVMNFGTRLASIFQFGGGSGQTRTEIWQAALAAIKARPVFGWGADTFRLVFPKFKPVTYVRDAGGQSVADNAHDYPLQLATGIGVLGAVMFYAIVVWAGVRSFRTVFARSDASRIVLGAFWAASFGYLIMLFFGLSVTGNTFLLWITLGMALAPTSRLIEVPAPVWGRTAAVGALVVVGAFVAYQFVFIAADNAYLNAQYLTDPAAKVDAALKAVRLQPYNGTYRGLVATDYDQAARAYLRGGAEAQAQGQDTTAYADAFSQNFANAEKWYKDVIAFMPYEYDTYVALADLYNLGGEAMSKDYYDKAAEVARQGLAVEPWGTGIRTELARAELGLGHKTQALALLHKVLGMDPRNGQAALVLATIYANDKQPQKALAVLKAVDALLPGQPGVGDFITQLEASATAAP
jgi:O-antigen ligase